MTRKDPPMDLTAHPTTSVAVTVTMHPGTKMDTTAVTSALGVVTILDPFHWSATYGIGGAPAELRALAAALLAAADSVDTLA